MAKIALLAKERSIDQEKVTPDDTWRMESGLILIPSIYCIRHSLELFLKSIDVGITNTYLRTHDNKELSKILSTIEISPENILKISTLVEKYTSYNFPEKIVNVSPERQQEIISDSMNEIFRYPDNRIGITIEGKNLAILNSLEILQDIEDIGLIFNHISTIWQLSKNKI